MREVSKAYACDSVESRICLVTVTNQTNDDMHAIPHKMGIGQEEDI